MNRGVAEVGSGQPSRGVVVGAVTVVVIAAVLIFFRLDQRLLWVDEAETALLARNILIYGVPKAYDGKNLISQEVGHEYGANYVWRWTPWLEKYLAAASFAVMGESTFSARFPFAVIGLLSVVSVYPLAFLLFRDRAVAVLAMAFLALSVPFLLHVRQCRYYSALVLGTIWAVYFFVGLARGKRGAVAGFTAAMTVLFHSNILTFVATAIALTPCAIVLRFDRAAFRRGSFAAGLILVINGPWAYYLMMGKTGETLYPFSENLRYQLSLASQYTFPAAAVLVFLALALLLRRRQPLVDARNWRPFLALIVFPMVFIVALSIAPWSFYRYTVGLLPLSGILLAFMCCGVFRWSRIGGGVFTVVLLLTGLFHLLSAWPIPALKYNLQTEGRSFTSCDTFFPLGNYFYEVTHPFVGPMEGLVQYLSLNARADDRIFISYGDLVLKFYTDHEIRGGQSGQMLQGWPEPEWVIIRSFFRFGDRPIQRADAQNMLAWLNNDVPPSDYQEVPAPWSDFPWDNIAEPDLHWFRVPDGGKQMQIFRRVTSLPAAVVP